MTEKDYYSVIKQKFEELFKNKVSEFHLEITAEGGFSQKIKSNIPPRRDLIFSFIRGKGQSPDITGFVKRAFSTDFIVIEIKERLKLDDIYQTMKYRDLFGARYTFLVALSPIPEEIKRLCKLASILQCPTIHQFFVISQFDTKTKKFVEWFEENPFENSSYWK